MHGIKKTVVSVMPISFVALDIISFVECSSHENHLTIPHNKYFKQDYDHQPHKVMSAQVIFDIKIHGILLWASMGLLMPLGILVIRMFNKDECTPKKLKALVYFHAILQLLAVLLATAAAILSIKSFENSFNNNHQKIGLALYCAIWLQALVAIRRPKRGSKGRTIWYIFHWIFGTTISLVGIFNTYLGLKAYHKRTSRSARALSILFTLEVSFMAFFYLFQEKWDYMHKQGVVLSDEPLATISCDQVVNQKEALPYEPSRKSNSLANYFAKRNALKKLFQIYSMSLHVTETERKYHFLMGT